MSVNSIAYERAGKVADRPTSTLLWGDGDWGIFSHKRHPTADGRSVIFHKCVKNVVEGMDRHLEDWSFPCSDNWNEKDVVWKCTQCRTLVPEEVLGIWYLHNFDRIAK